MLILNTNLNQEEKHILEPYSGKGDLICDDKEIVLSSGLQGSDGSVVKTEEFSFAVIKDQMLFQRSENMKEDPYGGEIETIGQEKKTEIQLNLVDNDQKTKDVNCKESDHNETLVLQSSKEQDSALIDHDEDSNSRGSIPSKSIVPEGQDLLVQLLHYSSICKDRKQQDDCEEGSEAFEMVEMIAGAEALKAVHVEKGELGGNMILMEEKEKKCNQYEVCLVTETAEQLKTGEILEAVHGDQHDHWPIDQTIDQDKKLNGDQVDGGTVTISGEEHIYNRHDVLLREENDGGLDEDKAVEPVLGKDLMLGKETGGEQENETDAAKLVDVIDPAASSNELQKPQTEEQENPTIDIQEDHYVSDVITSEKVTSENLSLEEDSEMREENVHSSEAASEDSEDGVIQSDIHPLKQSIGNTLEDIEEAPATIEISDEDSMDDDDDTDEANIQDKVELNSEGTGDSSVESSTEPIWPAESLEELSTESTELKHHDQKEEKQAGEEENKALETEEKIYENEGTSFLDKYMLELEKKNRQQKSSLKPRIPSLTRPFMVLSWALGFRCFGLTFLKISLIVILVILLSKIRGL